MIEGFGGFELEGFQQAYRLGLQKATLAIIGHQGTNQGLSGSDIVKGTEMVKNSQGSSDDPIGGQVSFKGLPRSSYVNVNTRR